MMTAEQANPSYEALVQNAIFELASDGFVIVGESGIVLRINASAARMFRYRADEIVGQPVERLLESFEPESDRSDEARPGNRSTIHAVPASPGSAQR